MTDAEKMFYKELYRVINDPKTNDLLVKYAQIEHDKAVKQVRSKQDEYFHGYYNGSADSWQSIMQLKAKITDIMRNIGA